MANTPNLDLEKPLGTDKALVARINSNSDKIDAWAGTTNQALSTLTYTGTVANLQTSLVSLANSMSIGEFHNIKYTAGETLAPFINSRIYGGTFKRTGSNYWSVTLEDPEGVPVYGTYRNGRWSWEPIALKSDVALDEYVVAGGLILRKFGKVCVLNGYYTWSSTQTGENTIGTLPAEYRPQHPVRTLANIGSNAWSYGRTAYFTIGDTGDVKVIPADSSGYVAVYVNCSWVLA